MAPVRHEQGTVMVMALLLVILIGSLASITLQRAQLLSRDTILERGRLQALQAAEGGLAKAQHSLGEDTSYRGEDLQVGPCAVSVEVVSRKQDYPPELWDVRVVAHSDVFGGGSRPYRVGIRATLRARPRGAPELVAWREQIE